MREYRITSQEFSNDPSIPDAILPEDDVANELKELQVLGGLGSSQRIVEKKMKQISETSYGEEISHNASQKAEYQRANNIRPGTEEWFKLWFSLPLLNKK